MKTLRTVLFWCHLAAGATAGVAILIMSGTGTLLALKPQILNLLERDVRFVQTQSTPRLGAEQLLAAAKADRPTSTPASIAIQHDPSTAAAIGLGRDGTVFVNPYTGAVLGQASPRTQGFFRTLEDWHRWLGVSNENRNIGRSITDASNLAFLGLAVSGLYLWWPRKWSVQHTRAILAFKRRTSGRARDFNWHNVIGFWCAPIIIIMTFSGVVMSYPWANDLLYRAMGSDPPVRNARTAGPGAGAAGGRAGGPGAARREGRQAEERPREDRQMAAPPIQIDRLWTRAEQQIPTWSLITLRLPEESGSPLAFTITDGKSWNAFARSQLALDAATGDIVRWQPYDGGSLGQKARGWLRFAHTGELAGLPGQLLAGIACAGGVVLVYTGLALALRRLLNWSLWSVRRRSTSTPSAVVIVETSMPAVNDRS